MPLSNFLIISWIIIFATLYFAWRWRKTIPASFVFATGIFLAAGVLYLPIYKNAFVAVDDGWIESILVSLSSTMKIFFNDNDIFKVDESISAMPEAVQKMYPITLLMLFIAAPLLTLKFVLSFFDDLVGNVKYFFRFKRDTFVFTELNEKSLAFVEDLKQNHGSKTLCVFTDVFRKQDERTFELVGKAKSLGAICIKKDASRLQDFGPTKNRKLYFFAISEDESVNGIDALKIIERNRMRANTELYVFSTLTETELLLMSAFHSKNDSRPKPLIEVRRVNDVQSLIFRTLYEEGHEYIFKSAYDSEDGMKQIHAVILGMGIHGTEMVKTLSWFCQMDGYRVEIDAFDADAFCEEQFISLCPELMDEAHNGVFDVEGEAAYKIKIHPGMDVTHASFDRTVMGLKRPTYIFISLGNDNLNIATAVKMRSLFKQKGYEPKIQAVCYNSEKKESLQNIHNHKDQAYDISFIGDIESSYTEKVIRNQDLNKKAKDRHLEWDRKNRKQGENETDLEFKIRAKAEDDANTDNFWQYDYYYKSSIALTIHHQMKEDCDIRGAGLDAKEREEADRIALRKLEHRRWNAYMRSEGYSYARERNDLAKVHCNLVPFNELPLSEQEKDDD